MESGCLVLEEIKKQCEKLIDEKKHPQIVVLGSYSYYLLKDYVVREIFKGDYDRYKELIFIEVWGDEEDSHQCKLEILIHRDTISGGTFNPKSLNVTVYGRD